MLLCGVFCICFTVHEHKNLKQKDIDTESYNQGLQVCKRELEKRCEDLKTQEQKLISSVGLLYEQQNELTIDQEILHDIINRLTQQKLNLEKDCNGKQITIDNQRREYDWLQAQITALNSTIETLTSSQKATARAALEQYFDNLDYQYTQKEREFDEEVACLDHLYDERQDAFLRQLAANEQELTRRREEYERDLDIVRSELDKIKSSRAAAIEAQLREQEIKDQAAFYTLGLNEADRRDVAYLRSIEFNLREARPLRMLIWTTFYRDRLNDLATRVGASGACGIYKITHTESGISYIGQAKDIKTRWSDHVKCSLGIDTPVTSQLYAFTREKGIDNFTFEILEKCSPAELNEKEKFYIDLYQTYDYGLNGNRGVSK